MKRKDTITKVESLVTPFGGSSHVILPKSWVGKKVKVTLFD